jgi:hypothetical protein
MEIHVMSKLDNVFVSQIMQASIVTSARMDIMTIQAVDIVNVIFMELNQKFVTN